MRGMTIEDGRIAVGNLTGMVQHNDLENMQRLKLMSLSCAVSM